METNISAMRAFTIGFLEISSLILTLIVIAGVLAIAYMYVVDKFQTKQTIRRNYPVLGRFRYMFEHMGESFRQYFFAHDREERPFKRAQRAWVYRAAKDVDSTVAFGSTLSIDHPGDYIFLNGLFPPLEEEILPLSAITFGEGYARKPFSTSSFFNISAMSYGALSAPAVLALSAGAKKAGIWLNTGEGGVSFSL